MISNLLDNAVKYTPQGGSIYVTAHPGSKQFIQISIKDTGIGISSEDMPHIFERFYRCDPSRSQAGTGLGLSFARAIARAHAGDITVTSEPGKGSTFTVVLPKTNALE
jgi:signal transduction histidine kinase